jgi:Leucine-rich repeat (LRR) protein
LLHLSKLLQLTHLDLDSCVALDSLSDLPAQLASLNLSNCEALTSLPSFRNLTALTSLNLSNCKSLTRLGLQGATALEKLRLDGCSKLELLQSSADNTNLHEWPTELYTLDEAGGDTLALATLELGGCSALSTIILHGCHRLSRLPESISRLSELSQLGLTGCTSLVHLPKSITRLRNLSRLGLTGCTSLHHLPESINELSKISRLDLTGCTALTRLPESIARLSHLSRLDLTGCTSLARLFESISRLKGLCRLELTGCTTLTRLPKSIGQLTKLSRFDLVGCTALTRLPESISQLSNLAVLDLTGCDELELVPDLRSCPLDTLTLRDCGKLTVLPRVSIKKRPKMLPTTTDDRPHSLSMSNISNNGGKNNKKEKVNVDIGGCDRIQESLAGNVDTTLNAILVAAALLATLGYSSLANPTDWDDSLGNPPGEDTLQVHGNAQQGWLAGYFILSQVSFLGSIMCILWCLISVLFNADAKRMMRNGGDRKRIMLATATWFLSVAIVAIVAAYFCAGMTSVSAHGKWNYYIVVTPTSIAVGIFIVMGFPDAF